MTFARLCIRKLLMTIIINQRVWCGEMCIIYAIYNVTLDKMWEKHPRYTWKQRHVPIRKSSENSIIIYTFHSEISFSISIYREEVSIFTKVLIIVCMPISLFHTKSEEYIISLYALNVLTKARVGNTKRSSATCHALNIYALAHTQKKRKSKFENNFILIRQPIKYTSYLTLERNCMSGSCARTHCKQS